MVQKWQYKVVRSEAGGGPGVTNNPNPESALNEAAKEGWELMQIIAYPISGRTSINHYFRREYARHQDPTLGPAAEVIDRSPRDPYGMTRS